jgi:GTP-binding protein
MLIKEAQLDFLVATPEMMTEHALPQIAFAGRSNVGKSSIINALTGRKKLARTSGSPGKTQQIFFYIIDERWHFVDLPGYGYAQVSKGQRRYFKVLVDRYFKGNEQLRACVLLLDPRRPVGEEEISFIHFLNDMEVAPVVVFTKWDRVRSSQRSKLLKTRVAEFAGATSKVITTSARTKDGVDQLGRILSAILKEKS